MLFTMHCPHHFADKHGTNRHSFDKLDAVPRNRAGNFANTLGSSSCGNINDCAAKPIAFRKRDVDLKVGLI